MQCPTLKYLPTSTKGRAGWPWTEESQKMPATMPDGKPWPKISIVTPNYNYGQFIEGTIRSVLLQGYPNLEYIIIDGGSTDNSIEIIRKYEKWLAYWETGPDQGQTHAINKGFARATGDIYAWLNSDDRYLPGALRTVAERSVVYPQAGAFVGRAQRIDVKRRVMLEKQVPGLSFEEILNWSQYLPQSSCFFRRDIWQQCGPLDETLQYQMDFDLWLKIAKKSSFIKLPEFLSQEFFHKEAKQVNMKYKADQWAERWLILMRHSEQRARSDMVKVLRELFGFYQKISSIPFYKFIRLIYKRKG